MARRVCLAFSLDWYSSNSAMNLAFLAKAHTVDEPVLTSAEDYPRCLDSFFHLSHRLEPGLESLIRRLQPSRARAARICRLEIMLDHRSFERYILYHGS